MSNRVLKLSKPVSFRESDSYKPEDLIGHILSFSEKFKIDINYFYVTGPYPQSGWKTKQGFINGLKQNNYRNIHHLIINDEYGDYIISYENWSSNRTVEVASDSMVLEMLVDESYCTNSDLVEFAILVQNVFDFDYGYILTQSKGHSINEGKVTRGIFAVRETRNKMYEKWRKYCSATKLGYIRNIYPINFITQQHLENPGIKDVIFGYGRLENKESYSIWQLSEPEIKEIKSLLSDSVYIVENATFDKSSIFNKINNEIK